MESCRIVLANEPRLLRGLLHYALAKAADVEVVGEVMDPARLPDAVAQGAADRVIVSLWRDTDLPLPIRRLVDAHPAVAVMGVAADGSRVKLYEPGVDGEQVMRGLSLSDLLAVLRTRHRDNGSCERG